MTGITFDRRRTCRHEAGHAAALIFFGHLPPLIDADWPSAGTFGVTHHGFTGERLTREQVLHLAIAIVCGPLVVDEGGWPPAFGELDRTAAGDLGQLAAAVSFLDLDEEAWDRLTSVAADLAAERAFGQLVDLIARALELAEVLTADDLRHLLGPRRLEAFGIDRARPDKRGTRT